MSLEQTKHLSFHTAFVFFLAKENKCWIPTRDDSSISQDESKQNIHENLSWRIGDIRKYIHNFSFSVLMITPRALGIPFRNFWEEKTPVQPVFRWYPQGTPWSPWGTIADTMHTVKDCDFACVWLLCKHQSMAFWVKFLQQLLQTIDDQVPLQPCAVYIGLNLFCRETALYEKCFRKSPHFPWKVWALSPLIYEACWTNFCLQKWMAHQFCAGSSRTIHPQNPAITHWLWS